MGRRALCLVCPPLAVCGWLGAYWLMHALAPEHHEARIVAHWYDAMHLCAGCVPMLALLLGLVLGRAVLVLGSELGLRLAAGCGLRPRFALPRALPLIWLAPELGRPPILASGHAERGPPLEPAPA
jgi:hypothetical protein